MRWVGILGERWWGYVWDERATTPGTQVAAPGAMDYRAFDSQAEAEAWCGRWERYVVTRYRARCAYEAGLPISKPEWAEHYRRFAALEAIDAEISAQEVT